MRLKDTLGWFYVVIGCAFAIWSLDNWRAVWHSQLTSMRVLAASLTVDADDGHPWFRMQADLEPVSGGKPYRWDGALDAAFVEEAISEFERWAPGAIRPVELNRGDARRARATGLDQNPRFNRAVLASLLALVFFLPAAARFFLPADRQFGPSLAALLVFGGLFPLGLIPHTVQKAYDRNTRWELVEMRYEGMTPEWSSVKLPPNIQFTDAGRKAIEGTSHSHYSYAWKGRKYILGDGNGESRLADLREEDSQFSPPQPIWINPAQPEEISTTVGWGRDLILPTGLFALVGLICSGWFVFYVFS